MARKGRDLELLIAAIEKMLGLDGKIKVKSPAMVKCKQGRIREHDVGLFVSNSHYDTFIAIECRDRKAKVDVTHVEAFAKKCENTCANHGVMVSRRGFTEGAIAEAKASNIRCLLLEKSDGFEWFQMKGFEEATPHIPSCELQMELDPAVAAQIPVNYTILSPDGHELSAAQLRDFGLNEFSNKLHLIERERGAQGKCVFLLATPGITVRDNDTGAAYPMTKAVLTIEYAIERKMRPTELHTYRDALTGDLITQVAHAKVTLADVPGHLLMVMHPDRGGYAGFVPASKPEGALRRLSRAGVAMAQSNAS